MQTCGTDKLDLCCSRRESSGKLVICRLLMSHDDVVLTTICLSLHLDPIQAVTVIKLDKDFHKCMAQSFSLKHFKNCNHSLAKQCGKTLEKKFRENDSQCDRV